MMDSLVSREPFRIPNRRMTDEVMIAFEQACEQEELGVAHELLCLLEKMLGRPNAHPQQDRRDNIHALVDAHHRLWVLRNAAAHNTAKTPAMRSC